MYGVCPKAWRDQACHSRVRPERTRVVKRDRACLRAGVSQRKVYASSGRGAAQGVYVTALRHKAARDRVCPRPGYRPFWRGETRRVAELA